MLVWGVIGTIKIWLIDFSQIYLSAHQILFYNQNIHLFKDFNDILLCHTVLDTFRGSCFFT